MKILFSHMFFRSGSVEVAISVMGTTRYNRRKVYLDNLVPDCIEHQLDGGMKIELEQYVAAMGFSGFYRYAEYRCNFFGSLALPHELHDLALPNRQSGSYDGDWSSKPSQVSVEDQVANLRTESGAVLLQRFHRGYYLDALVGLMNPPANARF